MNFPADLKYSEAHNWVRLEGESAVLGISDFAQEQLGDVVFLELPEPGTALKAGERYGSVESVKATSDLIAPVSGEITAVNGALDDSPELLNISPYGDGWIIKIKIRDMPAGLLSASEYEKKVL